MILEGQRQQALQTGANTVAPVDDLRRPEGSDLALMQAVASIPEPLATRFRPRQPKTALSRYLAEELAFRQHFLFVPVFIGAGASLWFSLPQSPEPWVLLPVTALLILLAIILRHRQDKRHMLLRAIALFATGMALASLETYSADRTILDTPVTTVVTGTVERRELDAAGRWRYTVEIVSTSDPVVTRPPERVQVLARSRHEPIAVGAAISGRARLSPPSGPALPGLNDFAFGSYFNGIGATGFFYGPPVPASLPDHAVETKSLLTDMESRLYLIRSSISERIRSVIGGDAGAFAASIITDERRAISEKTMEALRLSGLAHIVAISGLNMALAAGIFFVGMRLGFSLFPGFSQRWPVKKISAFAALLMTFAYYLISGFAVSAERAWLMMSIMLIAVLVDQPSISLRNVALSAIVILVLSPHEVMGPSFQMSFAATLALVAGYGFWSRWRADADRLTISRPPLWLSMAAKAGTIIGGVFITSLIGGLSTAAYSIEHFHRITMFGLAANLAAMPVMSIIVMPFALFAVLMMPFGLDAPFLKVMGYGMSLVIDIANIVASWGGEAVIGRQSQWFLPVSTLGFLLLTLLRTRLALLGLPILAVGAAMLYLEPARAKPDLLIYEDGALVALVSPDAVATTKARTSGFVYEQWEKAFPLPEKHRPLKYLDVADTRTEDDDDAPDPKASGINDEQRRKARGEMQAAFSRKGIFTCRKESWCATEAAAGTKIVVLTNTGFTGTACDIADIVITGRFVPFQSCRSSAILISRETLRRTGSLEIWLGNRGARDVTAVASMNSSERPWSHHRAYNWRERTFDTSLPAHITEILAR